jgi:hypothetical protein
MANLPSALPGGATTRVDVLTYIPTLSPTEDKRFDKKPKDKDDTESSKSSGWKWFKSDEKDKKKKEKEREKEREREREREEQAKKAKGRTEKIHDNARLDVLQNSMDNGRESLLLDRESIDSKLQEERRKESNRKTGDSRKERDRDTSFFGGLFGGSKKKGGDKDEYRSGKGKHQNRTLSPDPTPARPLRPDVDYPWTRFTIIEERAIYRMAHIKLANPRRSLVSQVLLSNFMYSYLAKVQAMHPQLQVPISPQQKRQEEERKRREAEEQQAELMLQQEMQQQAAEQDQFEFEYHRVSVSSPYLVAWSPARSPVSVPA